MIKKIENTLGERLKFVRIKNGLSTNKFAEILGISQSAITKIENGKSEPSSKTLLSLFENFNTDPLWLLAGHQRNTKISNQTSLEIALLADKLSEEARVRILEQIKREVMLEEIMHDQEMKKAASD